MTLQNQEIALVFEKRCGCCGMTMERHGGENPSRFARRTYCSLTCSTAMTRRAGSGPDHYRWKGRPGAHELYSTYISMIARRHHPNHPNWRNYGARGITVCDEWRASFQQFLEDVGDRPPGLTLDRIDNNEGYRPGNVRWATRSQQNHNRRPRSEWSPK